MPNKNDYFIATNLLKSKADFTYFNNSFHANKKTNIKGKTSLK